MKAEASGIPLGVFPSVDCGLKARYDFDIALLLKNFTRTLSTWRSKRRSTDASPTRKPRIERWGMPSGSTGLVKTTRLCAPCTLSPRQDWINRKDAADAQDCGAQATGYNVGPSAWRRSNPQNNSGRRCSSKVLLTSIRARRIFPARFLNPYLASPAAIRALSCGHTEPL